AGRLAEDDMADLADLRGAWREALRGAALAGFDAAGPLDPDAYRVRNAEALGAAQAVVAARRLLSLALAGYGKAGVELF
ncbi:hypothetical protein KK467_29460, partial [Klebsiella pneumoniae]|uniref:hypothetical protein n=1 Tax=Klebsiella pneumoniae TaxID=573 RepID=UPI001BE0DA75